MKKSKILVPLIAAIVTFFVAVIIISFTEDENKEENVAESTSVPTAVLMVTPSSTIEPTVAPTVAPTITPSPTTEPNRNNFSKAKVGEYIFFGQYEQDNNTSNGKEDIEWLVLDKQDNKVLVVSKYALDCKLYNEENENITWENCTLRTWLNNDFINAAFSKDEKAKIPTVTVVNDDNQEYDTDGGNDTQDKIFLLSFDEANEYFDSSEKRRCGTTDYAKAQGAYTSDKYTANGKVTCLWWLRSPGRTQDYAADVGSYGSVDAYGYYVYFDNLAVRPALWINLES